MSSDDEHSSTTLESSNGSDADEGIQRQVNSLLSQFTDIHDMDRAANQVFDDTWGTDIDNMPPTVYLARVKMRGTSTSLENLWKTSNNNRHCTRLEKISTSAMRVPKLSEETWQRLERIPMARAKAKTLTKSMQAAKSIIEAWSSVVGNSDMYC